MSADNYPSWEDGQKWKEKAERYEAALNQIAHGETDPEWQSSIIVPGVLRGIAEKALKEPTIANEE